MASHRGRGFSGPPPIDWRRSSDALGAVPRWLPADRCARARSARPHDARGEVLAAVHDPGRSRRPGERLLERRVRPADLVEAEYGAANAARAHAERINAIQRYFVERTRLGIPIIPFEEALHGLGARRRDGRFRRRSGSPRRGTRRSWRASRGRSAREDAEPRHSTGAVAGDQHRDDVRWGRVEETYGEDPVLTSRMGVAFVAAFETAGIVATPKHFVANVGEGGRDSYPIDFSERAARGDVLSAVRGGDLAGACAIGDERVQLGRRLAGDAEPRAADRQAQARLGFSRLRDLRRGGDRRRDGAASHRGDDRDGGRRRARRGPRRDLSIVVGAAAAVPRRVSSRRDRRFGDRRRGRRACCARSSSSACSSIRTSIADSAAYWNGHADHRALAREAARASIVLLKNDRGTLPLSRRMAIDRRHRRRRGRGAARRLQRAGQSAGLDPRREFVSARARRHRSAMRPGRAASRANTPSCPRSSSRRRTAASLCADCAASTSTTIASTGTPRLVRTDPRIDFGWTLNSPGRGIPFDWYSVRWTGTIIAPASGVRRIGVEGNDGYRLYLDGRARDRQLDEAVVRHAAGRCDRGRQEARTTFASSTSRAPATRASSSSGTPACRDDWSAKIERRRRLGAKERRRDRRRRNRGGRVPRSRVPRLARASGRADRARRGDRKADGRRAHRRQRDHDVAMDRSRRRGGRRVVSGRGGRPRRRRRAVRRLQPGRPAADHVPDVRRAASVVLQPQADRARRRLSRSHRSAAVSVRLRAELHDVRVFGALDRAGRDSAERERRRFVAA